MVTGLDLYRRQKQSAVLPVDGLDGDVGKLPVFELNLTLNPDSRVRSALCFNCRQCFGHIDSLALMMRLHACILLCGTLSPKSNSNITS